MHFGLLLAFENPKPWAEHSMRLFAKEVIPHFQK